MMALEIQKIMLDKGLKKKELADRMGWSQTNLYNKMRRDNFSESELIQLAEALNCTLELRFVPKTEDK